MKFTAAQIAEMISGRVEGNPDVEVWNVAKIEEGAPGMLSFLANPKYSSYLYTSQSSVIIINEGFELRGEVSATLIRVADAYAAFAQLLNIYQQLVPVKVGVSSLAFIEDNASYGKDVYIGPFVSVGRNVKIGDNVKIYPHCHIGDDVVIGDDTLLYPGVVLYDRTHVGSHCILHSGVVIGADGFGFAPQKDGSYDKIPQVGNVIVEDNVEIGANTTVDRATMGSTYIRRGVKLDNLVMVAHNVEVGTDTVIAAQTGISGSTKLESNCVVGGQVGFAGHLHIAKGSQFGAQSGIHASISEPGKAYMGSPAIMLRDYQRMFIRTKNLEQLSKKVEELERKLIEINKKQQ